VNILGTYTRVFTTSHPHRIERTFLERRLSKDLATTVLNLVLRF
jgi:hypothetical protein